MITNRNAAILFENEAKVKNAGLVKLTVIIFKQKLIVAELSMP